MAHPTSASQPRRPGARLQPGRGPGEISHPEPPTGPGGGVLPVGQDLLAEAETEVLQGGKELSRQERDRARQAAESLARRGKDLEKLNSLALQSFSGPNYEIFAGELSAYGYPVLLAWLRRGVIFKYCAEASLSSGSESPIRSTSTPGCHHRGHQGRRLPAHPRRPA